MSRTKRGSSSQPAPVTSARMGEVQALLANNPTNIARDNDLVKSQRMSANIRLQLGGIPRPHQIETEKKERRKIAAVSAKDFAVHRGVSMEFINDFYNRFNNDGVFKNVKLFVHKKTGITVSWDNDDKSKIVKGMAMARVHTGTHDTEEPFKIGDLKKKSREHWTVADVTNFCIYPELTKNQSGEAAEEEGVESSARTYLDIISQEFGQEKVGQPGIGYYILADPSARFSELIKSLQDYIKDETKTPYDTYIFLEMFSFDLEKIRRAIEFGDKTPKLRQAYSDFLANGVHDMICGFDDRFVFIESWEHPQLLRRLWCVWQLYCMRKSPYKILSSRYDNLNAQVWNKQEDNLFTMVDLMDPTSLVDNPILRELFAQEVSKQNRGMSAIQKVISEGLTHWFTEELEDNLRLMDANDKNNYGNINEDMYIRVSEDLLKAGKFNYWRSRHAISKTFLDDALKFYNSFELEAWLKHTDGKNRTAIEMERPSHFTADFRATVLEGLINVRLFLGRVLAHQTLYQEAIDVIKDAETAARYLDDATKKSDYSVECQIAFAEIYMIKGENKEAIARYNHAELSWKGYKSEEKKSRVVKIRFQLGGLLRGQKSYKKALEVLNLALKDHVDYLMKKEKREDVLQADILLEIARVHYVRGSKSIQEARVTFEKAQQIVQRIIGAVNIRAAKIEYFIGNCYSKQKSSKAALQKYDNAINLMQQCLGMYCTQVATIFKSKGGTYRALAKRETDEEKIKEYKDLELQSLQQALDTISRIRKPEVYKKKFLDIASYSINVADTLCTMGEFREAQKLYKTALDIRKRELGDTDKETVKARKLLFTNKRNMA